jgi:dihydrofolate synthase / folylpolyglutamate synthase
VQAYRAEPLDPAAVREGFAAVRSPGRLELLFTGDGVPVLLDGAHNPAAAEVLTRTLRELHDGRRRVLVLGILADKDIAAMAQKLRGAADEVVLTVPNVPRAAPLERLRAACRNVGVPIAAEVGAVAAAVDEAASRAGRHGMVVVTGSLYTVGEARAALGGGLL